MGSGGKTESVLPKRTAEGFGLVKAGEEGMLGSLRFQHYDDDRVHVHDDTQKLVFEYRNKRHFQLVIDGFLREAHRLPVGTVAVAKGDDFPENGRSPANLVLTRTPIGWKAQLLKKAGFRITKKKKTIILTDEVLSFLDDFNQGL